MQKKREMILRVLEDADAVVDSKGTGWHRASFRGSRDMRIDVSERGAWLCFAISRCGIQPARKR
jgi:hypothetical protein